MTFITAPQKNRDYLNRSGGTAFPAIYPLDPASTRLLQQIVSLLLHEQPPLRGDGALVVTLVHSCVQLEGSFTLGGMATGPGAHALDPWLERRSVYVCCAGLQENYLAAATDLPILIDFSARMDPHDEGLLVIESEFRWAACLLHDGSVRSIRFDTRFDASRQTVA